jgi:hypothetical protein
MARIGYSQSMRNRLAWPLVVFLVWPPDAFGHALDLSSLEINADAGRVEETLDLSIPAVGLLVDVDSDHDGIVTQAELDAHADAVFAATFGRAPLSSGGASCALRSGGVTLAENRVLIRAKGECQAGPIQQVLVFLRALPPGHQILGRAQVDGVHQDFAADSVSPTVVLQGGSRRGLRHFVWLGMQHIWTGYDHLMFLLGLLLLGGNLKRLFAMVSSFTVAHSITLALAALGIVGLPSRLVESAIALSIAYVAAEDFLVQRARMRWLVAFGFGLVHGFGFASALSELRLRGSDLAIALFGFNLGVEVGQAAVVAVAWPLLLWLRRSAGFRKYGVRAVAALVFAFGVFWFIQRAFGL